MPSITKEVKKEEKKIEKNKKEKEEGPKKCIICGAEAHYFVKGLPHTCYCRDCALKQFKQLNYLEKF